MHLIVFPKTAWPSDLHHDPVQRHEPDEFVPLSPIQPLADRLGLGALDPLLARIGVMVLVAALLVPIALAMRAGNDSQIRPTTPVAGAAIAAVDGGPSSPAGSMAPGAELAAAAGEAPAASPSAVSAEATSTATPDAPTQGANVAANVPAASPAASTSAASTSNDSSASVGDVIQSEQPVAVQAAVVQAASASAAAERYEPACPTTYVAARGDSWYRIADAAGVTPKALLAENRATLDTVILVGDDICLPPGATMPSPPSTTAPAPVTTAPPATTQPPAATVPATTAPAATPATPDQVQQLIRDIWPDELEEKALQVAWRESNYRPTLYNGTCCYGVFQIYWTVHRSWLDDYGVYSSNDLRDARKNIEAAYALYQRSGGWGPWGG